MVRVFSAATDSHSPHLLPSVSHMPPNAPRRYDRDANELVSEAASLAFPVVGGVPQLLLQDARHLSAAELADVLSRTVPPPPSHRK